MSSSPERPLFFRADADIPQGAKLVDGYSTAIRELFFIDNPEIAKNSPGADEPLSKYMQSYSGSPIWAYLPWSNVAVKLPDEESFYRLRTARNRNIITPEEQRRYRESTVGIAGLSVGSTALASLVRTGGPKTISIADHDTVEISNLNRMHADLVDLGEKKTVVAARKTWEIDPFADLRLWSDGLHKESLRSFIDGDRKLDVFVDEMDDIPLKFAARIECRELQVPVVMATDNGDGAIVDVERFDLEPQRAIFHGRVEESLAAAAKTREQFIAASSAIIDASLFAQRQGSSLREVGKTIAGVPQLGTAATIAGASVAYAIRQIVTGAPMPSGRYIVSTEKAISADSRIS